MLSFKTIFFFKLTANNLQMLSFYTSRSRMWVEKRKKCFSLFFRSTSILIGEAESVFLFFKKGLWKNILTLIFLKLKRKL
jgi:hypothetical protein